MIFGQKFFKILLKKINHKNNITSEILAEVKKEYIDNKTFTFNENLPPIPVKSAFGGFGIYKMEYVLKINETMKVHKL